MEREQVLIEEIIGLNLLYLFLWDDIDGSAIGRFRDK